MKACALALLAASILVAADDRQLAIALKGQSDFDRVELVARPRIADAEACVQSQAAALAVSLPDERSLLHFRKGYCAFAGAVAPTRPNTVPRCSAVTSRAFGGNRIGLRGRWGSGFVGHTPGSILRAPA